MSRTVLSFSLILLLGLALPVFAQYGEVHPGSFKNPYPLRHYSDSVDGISLRAVGLQRPAEPGPDSDPTAPGQEYVVVSVELTCDPSRSENCRVATYDFELAGSMGIIYPNAMKEDENAFDIAPGAEAFGDISAYINSADTDLLLLFYHWPNIPYTFPLVFAAEPAPEMSEGMPVNATVGMIARVGPSSDLDFTGVFNHGEQLLALGRNADGAWLEIAFGWVPADLVEAEGDIMSLPVTSAFE
ncbi:MAG: hypothetical protein OXG39_07160 [Chloroflexi bacterium]|nr:hypothetical protein [Chloroflexota bacterium]